MNSVFLLIFVSFWLVLVLVLAVTLRLSYRVASERAAQISEFRRIDIVRSAEDAIINDGAAGFERWLKKAPLPPSQTIFLLDEDGRDILGRELPRAARNGFRRHQQRMLRTGRTRVPVIVDADGRRYLFVFGPIRAPMLGVLSLPRVVMALFVAALIISAIVCFFLARYLTAPLTPMMQTARRLSEGDLDARIGDRRRNDELGALSAQFDNMADALQQQMESRQDLLRNVSHELRSPLARMMIALELAKQAGGETPHLDRIEREAEHMNELTAQILDLARAQAGVQADTPVDLSALLDEITEVANFEGAPDQKRVVLDIGDQLPTIRGNTSLLRSALDNIVRNALRYSPEAGSVTVRARSDGQQATIAISDNGPGVTPENLEKLFVPFFKGASSDGSGVGLALSAQIASWHGGSIRAENNPAPMSGLTVTLTLPVPRSDEF